MNFKIARAGLHMWEEPVISGEKGSGTIFFSGCSLRCVYCQNYRISHENRGLYVPEDRLADLMLRLEDDGAHNINLVTPSHYIKGLPQLLQRARERLKIPIVYNSGGYDNVEDLKDISGLIDVYLPDFKYAHSDISYKYSGRADYFEIAYSAIKEMRKQQPADIFENGLMKRGVIVRHLILPDNIENSLRVLDALAQIDKTLYVSLMSQYFPTAGAAKFEELTRRIGQEEYDKVCEYFFEAGLSNGFAQELSSAIEDYVPDFDLEELKKLLDSL